MPDAPPPPPGGSRLRPALAVILGGLALFTLLGLVVLWPSGEDRPAPVGSARETIPARVVEVALGQCRAAAASPGSDEARDCRRVGVELESGPDAGERTWFDLGPGFDISPGDSVRVTPSGVPEDAQVGGVPVDRYAFADFERRSPLIWLAVAFCALVIVTARWRGLRALLGLAVSLAIVVFFVVPAIAEGASAPAVAAIGALAIMLTTIPVAHGMGPKSVAALAGTGFALAITTALAHVAADLAHLTGFGSDEAAYLNATQADSVSVHGLLIAGVVIGALGVLDDLTVSQASTVMALRQANPALGARDLFRRGMGVGHDHIVAMVNTLVLAYVGASLPVLLVFSVADTSVGDALNSEVVASEIVATLAGSIGLIAAAPIVTALAALLAVRIAPDRLDAGHHHHHH